MTTTPPCKTITVTLTGEAGIGWNFIVMRDEVPLPAEDPQDLPTAAAALRGALEQLKASFRPPEGSE